MMLEDALREALIEAGERLQKDLWSGQDALFLAQRARDLAGLYSKLLATDDLGKRAQYQLAADLIVHHVSLLALLRLQEAERRVVDEIVAFFREVLAQVVPALIAAI